MVILAKNEENNIEGCVDSVKGWAGEVIVVDDESGDKTSDMARKKGARVIKRKLMGDFAAQRNFGLAKSRGGWVLFLDADERVDRRLRDEMLAETARTENAGFYLRRTDVMWGRNLNYGETGRVRLLRLARREVGKWERRVDEKWVVKGETGELSAPLYHYPHQTVSQFLEEVNFKSSLNAEQFYEEKKRIGGWEWGKPVVKFVVSWLWWQGWRDGGAGMAVAVVMSLHSFLVRGKLYLLKGEE